MQGRTPEVVSDAGRGGGVEGRPTACSLESLPTFARRDAEGQRANRRPLEGQLRFCRPDHGSPRPPGGNKVWILYTSLYVHVDNNIDHVFNYES